MRTPKRSSWQVPAAPHMHQLNRSLAERTVTPEPAIFPGCLPRMARIAQRLPILSIPEQPHVALMRHDVIRARCQLRQRMHFVRIDAPWMLHQSRRAGLLPSPSIPAPGSAQPLRFTTPHPRAYLASIASAANHHRAASSSARPLDATTHCKPSRIRGPLTLPERTTARRSRR